MATFSEDVLSRIMRELNVATLARAGLACKAWRIQVWGRVQRVACVVRTARSFTHGLPDHVHGARWRALVRSRSLSQP